MAGARYEHIIARRRAFSWPGFATYADVGLDGDWVTPYHIASAHPSGPVLLTYNYLDAPSAFQHRDRLLAQGYLPKMPFNRVLDQALALAGMARGDLYVTHAFHLLPRERSARVPASAVNASFDAIACHELAGRRIIALGTEAQRQCRRHGLPHLSLPHLSARGTSFADRALGLAGALERLG